MVVRGAGKLLVPEVIAGLERDVRARQEACLYWTGDGKEERAGISGDQAWDLAEGGCTMTLRGIARVNASILRIGEALYDGIGREGHLGSRLFLSTASSAFPMHFDPLLLTITLQLEGTKRWLLGPRAIDSALSGGLRSVLLPPAGQEVVLAGDRIPYPDLSGFRAVVLHPGDMLYLPPGVWHRAATSERSLSLSLDWIPPQISPWEFQIEVVDHRGLRAAAHS